MELDALKFTVETTALDDAITKVGTLQLAVKKLGSDTGSQSARQAAKEQAQITLDQVKAETALIEARGKQARAIENLNSPQEKLTKSVKDSNAVLERQEKIYENMINYGLSKGQASTLAMAQAQDIAAESAQKLVDVMKDTRKYIGGDTFDKSTAGMTAMQNRYETLLIAAKNYADGSVLNIRQAQDLALDTERLAAKNQLLGISGAEAVASINSMTAAFKALAIQENEQSRANDAHAALIKKNSESLAAAERERVQAHLNSGQVLFENNQLRLKQDQQTNKAIMSEMAAYYKAIEAQDLAHSKALLKSGKAQVDTTGNAAVALFVKDQQTKARAVAKSAEDQVKSLAKADEMLARLQNRTKEMSKESPVSATAANQLYAYEKALKAAGVGATEATARLAVFRAEQQKVSQLARAEETLRMQHLSRALAPQVTDVTVGLMTGQNPFTVFLQQGGQIRDQIGLSQVAVENLGKVFKDTFVMMGAMVAAMGRALYAFFATPVGAVVLALAALAIGIYKVGEGMLEAETRALEINKALILFGNTAGLTVESLKGLSKEAASMEGISLSKSTEAMIAFSKAGEMTSDEFVKASQSAVMFEKYAGVAISDTAKAYKELSKDPLKAVSKLNEETGFFTATIIKQIAEYERLGDKEAAAALSRKTYTDATMQAALDIKDSLSGLGLFMDSVGNIATEMWKKIKGLSVQAPLKEQRDALVQELSILGQAEAASKGQGKRTNVLMVDPAIKQKMQELELLQDKIDKADNRAAEQQRNTASGKDMSEYQSMINANKLKTESKQQKIDRINIISAGDIAIAAGKGAEEAKAAIEMRDKLIRDIETGKGGPKKAKSESTEAFSINLSNELQQYEKQYSIEIKLQDDFIRQEKARLDNALAAKEITQGEFNARDLAASERGYTDRQALSDKYYSGIIQANEKNISEMVQQYQAWVNQEGGTPKFFEQNEKAVETLRSKIINTNNETSVFLEKIQASAASAKENAFTRYSKQLSTLQGEIRGITLAYDEYLQSEANLTKQKQAQVALEDKVRFATPEQAIAIRAAADETERLTKQVQDYDKQIRASKMSLEDAVNVYLDELSLTGKVSENAQKQLDLLKDKYDLLVKTKGLVESTVESKSTEAYSASIVKSQKDQMKALSDSVAGAIEIGLFDGGQAGSKALRNIIEAELRKPITVFIKAVVGDIVGSLTGDTTGASTGGMSGGSGLLSTLSSAYDALAGKLSFSGSNSFINAANSSLGGSLGLSNTFGTSATAGQMAYTEALMSGATAVEANTAALTASQANLTTFGKGVGMAGDALSGYSLQKAISGDKTIAGGKVVDAITLAASAIPGVGPVAGVIAGVVNRAFGMGALEMTGAGTRGTFSTSGFQGQNYQNYKREGGWFRSDENTTDISAVPDATVKSWSTAFSTLKKSMTDSVEVLGLSAESFKNYSKYVDVAAGTTKEGLTALFTGMADEMVQGLLGTVETTTSIWRPSEFVKEGETASQTITRLSTSLKEVNTWFSFLGNTLLEVSLKGGDTASKLADVFGGLDKFSAAAGAYYEAFYTEQERASRSSLDMAKALALVGLEMPKTKDEFRGLVDTASKNLDTASLRETYALLLTIAPEFSNVADVFAKAIEDNAARVRAALNESASLYFNNIDRVNNASKLTTEASGGIDKFLGTASKAIEGTFDKQIAGIKEVGAAASTAVSAWSSIASTVKGVLDGIYKQTATLLNKSFSDLYTEFTSLNLKAKGGDVASASKLSDIATAALTASENQSLTLAQYLTERAIIASGLEDTLETANDNISIQQSILDASNSSVSELQSINTTLSGFAADVYELLSKGYVGADKSTANIAVDKLVQMTADSAKFFQDYKEGQTFQGNGFSATRLSGGLGQMNFEGGGSTFISQSESILEAAKRSPELRALWEKTYGITLPSFDIGSNYVPYDMTANIHEGERIIPKADNLELMNFISNPQSTQDNSGIINELRNLRQELNEIKTLQKVNNSDTKKTADTLINVTLGGEAMQTQTIP